MGRRRSRAVLYQLSGHYVSVRKVDPLPNSFFVMCLLVKETEIGKLNVNLHNQL